MSDFIKKMSVGCCSVVFAGGLCFCGYALAETSKDNAFTDVPPKNDTEYELPTTLHATATSNSIIVELIEGAEYSLDRENWQDSNIFAGLSPAQQYTVSVRLKRAYSDSDDIVSATITTDKTTQSIPTIDTSAVVVSANSIELSTLEGAEYSLDNENWQTESSFVDLLANTDYTVYVRYAETSIAYASEPQVINVTTLLSAGLYDSEENVVYAWQELLDNNLITVSNNSITSSDTSISGTLVIADGITSIETDAFRYSSLNKIYIADSVTTIENGAFQQSETLESVILPSNITRLSSNLFSNCTSLKTCVLPDTITSIGNNCFFNCSSLTNLVLSSCLSSIGDYAFYDALLDSLTVLSSNPPTFNTFVGHNFMNVDTIYIPAGTLEAYQSASGWSNYADKFVELEA